MKIKLSSNAAAFSKNLIEYCKTSNKGFSDALAAQGGKFSQELFNQFHAIRPARNSIFDAAASRGFRVARLSITFLVQAEGNLSQRAVERAKELLGGRKSDLFRPLNGGYVPLRFSARGKNRVLLGGRTGWRFSRSALRGDQLTAAQLKTAMQDERAAGAVRLNLRALATYLELRYRTRGAQGGVMAVQWLQQTYKWSTKGTYKTTQLVQRSATGLVIGTVDFETSGNALTAIVFTGYVPGTPEQAQKRGILDKVFAVRAADLLQAIANAHAKSARQNHLN